MSYKVWGFQPERRMLVVDSIRLFYFGRDFETLENTCRNAAFREDEDMASWE